MADGFSFEPDTLPEAKRTRPNHFIDPVSKLAAKYDEEAGRSVEAFSVNIPADFFNKARRDLTEAADALDTPRTVRAVKVSEDKKAGTVKIKFWLVNKIRHNKGTDDAAGTSEGDAATED